MSRAPSAAEMETVLGALLPPGVAVAVWSGPVGGEADPRDMLGPRDREAMARAVPKRQVEFARGRWCAREALARAGYEHAVNEIPVGPSREPVWPDGFTGSITHCEGLVAAVAAPLSRVRGIGLDAEVDRPLPREVVGQVITPEEGSTAGTDGAEVRFSAKESIHKSVFPLTGVWLDFLDVAVELDGGALRARAATGARTTIPELERVRGRYARTGGLILTVVWAPHA